MKEVVVKSRNQSTGMEIVAWTKRLEKQLVSRLPPQAVPATKGNTG